MSSVRHRSKFGRYPVPIGTQNFFDGYRPMRTRIPFMPTPLYIIVILLENNEIFKTRKGTLESLVNFE